MRFFGDRLIFRSHLVAEFLGELCRTIAEQLFRFAEVPAALCAFTNDGNHLATRDRSGGRLLISLQQIRERHPLGTERMCFPEGMLKVDWLGDPQADDRHVILVCIVRAHHFA